MEEKLFRTTNYLTSLHAGLYNISAAAGVDSPKKLERKHILFKDSNGRISPVENMLQKMTGALEK